MPLCLAFILFFAKFVWAENTASELFALGQTAESTGDRVRAIDFYERAIEADTDLAAPYSALAMIYLEQNGNIDDIVWLFQQAADIEPQNAEHYTNMCRAYFQFQKHDWAESTCLKALSIDPNAGAAKMTLAWVYLFGKSQPADAIRYFKDIIEKVPNPKIYYGLGMAYISNNQQANALDVIMTLRGMGEETLASQLEKMMRTSSGPVNRVAIAPPNLNAGPSEIVGAKPPAPAPEQTSEVKSLGKIRIQLKAQLPSVSTSTSLESSTGNATDDGYDLEDYRPLTLKERQDRVRRMRGDTGKAKGRATVTTQTTAAP